MISYPLGRSVRTDGIPCGIYKAVVQMQCATREQKERSKMVTIHDRQTRVKHIGVFHQTFQWVFLMDWSMQFPK